MSLDREYSQERMSRLMAFNTGALNWTRPRWISDELVMEEARRRERAGEGRVEDDGHPPARWIPKESE